jgi:hypothetical protein
MGGAVFKPPAAAMIGAGAQRSKAGNMVGHPIGQVIAFTRGALARASALPREALAR